MSKTWIDERPLEEIIRTTVPNTRFADSVEDVLLRIHIDSQFQYKLYKSNSQATLYDLDIEILTFKINQLLKDIHWEDDKFNKYCEQYGKLAKYDSQNTGGEDYGESVKEEEEEEEVEVEEYVKGQKDFVAVKNKAQKGDDLKQILKQIQQLKSHMASSQEKLRGYQQEKEALELQRQYYTHYQYADRVYFSFMKKLVSSYEKQKDEEFLKQGLYCILQYWDMMRRRYVPKDACVNDKGTCSLHYLPFADEGAKRCVLHVL